MAEDTKKAPAVKLVKMTRDAEIANGKPTEAEVHPDEVDNYSRAGWVKC